MTVFFHPERPVDADFTTGNHLDDFQFSSGNNLIYFLYFSVIPEFPNFFYDVVADDKVGNRLLEFAVFFPKLRDFFGGCLAKSISGELLFTGFNELLIPFVEGRFLNSVLATEFGYGGFSPKGFHHNEDFLLRSENPSCFSADVF
ncbi:hypothetical protein [Epilithonimonas hominis]|uniref:hypothetical protein n=1 Tax=Epilithonimonas hominis TaxID=420404 RepID=UPI0028A2DC84|nr:hypothetical protein [Epilithonimonas hominis]